MMMMFLLLMKTSLDKHKNLRDETKSNASVKLRRQVGYTTFNARDTRATQPTRKPKVKQWVPVV